jgi:hypothetical protein
MVKDEDEARCSFPDLGMVDGGGWLEVASRHIRRNFYFPPFRHMVHRFIGSGQKQKARHQYRQPSIREIMECINRYSQSATSSREHQQRCYFLQFHD